MALETPSGDQGRATPNNVESDLSFEQLRDLMVGQDNTCSGCCGCCDTQNCQCQHCRCRTLCHVSNNQNTQDYGGAGNTNINQQPTTAQAHHAESVDSLESDLDLLKMDVPPESKAPTTNHLTASQLRAWDGQQDLAQVLHDRLEFFLRSEPAHSVFFVYDTFHDGPMEHVHSHLDLNDLLEEGIIIEADDTAQSTFGLGSPTRSSLYMSDMTSASASAFLTQMGALVRFNGQPMMGPTPYLRLTEYGCPRARFFGPH